jgi:hypothetical protein
MATGNHTLHQNEVVYAESLVVNGNTLTGTELGYVDGVTAGTVTASKAVVVDASKDIGDFRNVDVVNLDAGASGVAGTVDIFPTTASKGKLAITCTDQTGDTTVTLTAGAMGQATAITIPDPGGASASVVLTAGSQTVAGVKTFSSTIVSPGVTSASAAQVACFAPIAVQQALSGAGAVNLTTYYTAITNTGSDALTLADATVVGHTKKVQMIVDPGTDSTLTFNSTATIVFADVGDYAILVWNGSDWIPVELGNDADGVTAPVYTPAA